MICYYMTSFMTICFSRDPEEDAEYSVVSKPKKSKAVRNLKMPFFSCILFGLLPYFIVFVYHILIVYDIQIQIKIIVARNIKLRQSKE